MAVKIADIARENKKLKTEIRKTHIALISLSVWVLVLSFFVFFV